MNRTILTALFACSAALGSPITWTLSGVTFSDGGAGSGFFVFDADTDAITNWDISTTAGSVLSAFEFTTVDSVATGPASLIDFRSNQTFPNGMGQNENRFLLFGFATPLTDAGGTVNLNANQPFGGFATGSGECLNCNPFRFVSAGSVTTTGAPAPTPEPRFAALAAIVLLALLTRRHGLSRLWRR